jgi:hypothetical protein
MFVLKNCYSHANMLGSLKVRGTGHATKEAIATPILNLLSSNSPPLPTLAPQHALKQLCTRLYDTSAIMMQLAAMDLATQTLDLAQELQTTY